MNGIPHLSVCGGRARCSTCRVEVLEGGENLPEPNGAEANTLAGINAGPKVRLACQLRPTYPITINLLLRPGGQTRKSEEGQGVERTLAVLFLDVRGFTAMSQDKLPYDVVFIRNRLFADLGDGLMAVFGRDTGAADGCQRAIRAARKIDLALDQVNQELESELDEPLKIGMGLHVGSLVLGEIGHDHTAAMTVIGRTVNAASRLESATKDMQCQFVMSTEAANLAGLDLKGLKTRSVTVRGLTKPLRVVSVESARHLP
jgi:adenylate cyclase